MQTLTKANAKNHCRTCLAHLGEFNPPNNNEVTNYAVDDEMQEFKDISIHIANNTELRRLLAKFVDEKFHLERLEQVPQRLCLGCYNKLQAFGKFHKRALDSAQKLQSLLASDDHGITKIELAYEGDVPPTLQHDGQREDDIYKLLLKDTLMETESVLLDDSAVATLTNIEIHEPDPFDALATTKTINATSVESNARRRTTSKSNSIVDSTAELENSNTDNTNSDVEDEDDEEDKEEKEESDKYANHLSRLRSGKKFLSSKSFTATHIQKKKKKRRTKKEMEELRKEQIKDKQENKIKRRNKGTKNNFKCSQCNHCFAHKITLDAHIRKVHEGSKRPFKCDRCDKSYTFNGGLYTHIKEIHETEVRSYRCDFQDCERVYTSSIAMQKHKRVKHFEKGLQQKKYVCEQCGATFNQTGNLKYHRRSKHPTADEQAEKKETNEHYKCGVCSKIFRSRYTLKYHTLQLHSNDMKYECKTCGRRMAKKFMLIQHMLVHSTDKMPCEHCGKQFIRKFELEAHIRAVHMKLKPYECQFCSECFASRKTLRHHEYIHTGEKPYVCDICGQAYRQQTCLKNHRKGHEKSDASLSVNINRTLLSTFLGTELSNSTNPVASTNALNDFN